MRNCLTFSCPHAFAGPTLKDSGHLSRGDILLSLLLGRHPLLERPLFEDKDLVSSLWEHGDDQHVSSNYIGCGLLFGP